MTRRMREGGDDFFCWKYQLWYSLRDCVFRHGWATTEACAECEQGAANLKLLGPPPAPARWTRLPAAARPRGRQSR